MFPVMLRFDHYLRDEPMKDAPPDFEEMVATMDRLLRETSAGEVPTPRLMEALQSNDGRLTLGECLHRRMRLLYAEKSGVWSNYCRQGEAVDFRGGAVRTYEREVRLNLRMVVNDDPEAFGSMPDRHGSGSDILSLPFPSPSQPGR
jgi:hypothetical protein